MTDYGAESRTYFPALCKGTGTNHPFQVVIHDTEGDTGLTGAETTARFFQTNPNGSTQIVVDDDSRERCVDDDVIACGVAGSNTGRLHVEQSGRAAWSRDEWLTHIETIKRAAWAAADWCHRFSIPVRWLEVADLLRAEAGITSHWNLTKAFHISTHTDPGPNYPYDAFMGYVVDFYADPTGGEDMTKDQAQQLADVQAKVAHLDAMLTAIVEKGLWPTLDSTKALTSGRNTAAGVQIAEAVNTLGP